MASNISSSGSNRVRLEIHAQNLKNAAAVFKGTSDPFAIITMLGSSPTEAPTVIGKTEVYVCSYDCSPMTATIDAVRTICKLCC